MDFASKLSDDVWEHPEFWKARGVGRNGGWKSLVTGEEVFSGPDVSGFVRSKEAGERLLGLLDGRAHLDFRPREPHWIQLKLIVEEEHVDVLHRLCEAVWACEGVIQPRLIAWALRPQDFPGYEPRALRAIREKSTN